MRIRFAGILICMILLFGTTGDVFAAETDENVTEVTVADINEPEKVSEIRLNLTSISLHIGTTKTLKASVLPQSAANRNYKWSVSNTKVAEISAKGVVTAKKTGSCKVYCVAQDGSGVQAVCKVTVKKRVYQRSAKYYPIQSEITLPSGGYNLSRKNIGLKVIRVNKKLLHSTNARYTFSTYLAVKNFQKKHHIKATGTVNLKTWQALGFSRASWYDLGTYRTPLKVNGASKRQDYINAMLNTAKEYAKAGTAYRVGCSGKPGTYVDCSGLIFQCLYAAGINPEKNIVDHALAKYEYTSRYLAADRKLGKVVSVRNKKKGDLLFYGSYVYHVAIYAGNGYIYDSWPGIGVTKRKFARPISKVIRVF